jgi:protein-S-isoprenylcysteine O-methyltransferase Ste14
MPDTILRAAFIAVFSLLSLIRLYFKIAAGLFREPPYSREEKTGTILFRSALGVPLLLAVAGYCFLPARYRWAYVTLPHWLRFAAVGLAFSALALLVWAHRALGGNFSTGVGLRRRHRMVRDGPYALMRHPMYAAYFLLFVAAFLMSGNWVIGTTGLAIIVMLMTWRLNREERLLLERFGQAYRDYAKDKGRFMPRPRLFAARASRPPLPPLLRFGRTRRRARASTAPGPD